MGILIFGHQAITGIEDIDDPLHDFKVR